MKSRSQSSDDYHHHDHDDDSDVDSDDDSDERHSSSEESVHTTSSSPSTASSASHPEASSYRLPPQEVLDLAKSLPNCCVVAPPPPPPTAAGTTLQGNSSSRSTQGNSGGDGHPVASSESATPASFSDWRRHFRRTFFDDDREEDGEDGREEEKEAILSFLVTDPETEAADRGGGVARVDVYCRTGTVCTCRVVPVVSRDAVATTRTTTIQSSDSVPVPSPNSNSLTLVSSLLATPRTANVQSAAANSPTTSPSSSSFAATTNHPPRPPHAVRRILRRKCSLAALRRIFETPPRLLELPPSLVADPSREERDDGSAGSSRRSSAGSSTASRASRRRRRGRAHRRSPPPAKTWRADPFTPQQRRFLETQRRNYRRRMRREERGRDRIAESILAGDGDEEGFLAGGRFDDADGDGEASCQAEDGASQTSASTAGEGGKAAREVGLGADMAAAVEKTFSGEMGTDAVVVQSTWDKEQRLMRRRIELADTALAILMGEAEVLEKMMAAFDKEEEEREADEENVAKEEKRKSDRCQSKRNGRRKHDGRDDNDSVSTLDNTNEPDEDDDSFYDESEAEEIAKLLQGCQIEYSFPFEHHPDLEDALLPRRHSISDEDEDEDDTSNNASTDGYRSETDESKTSFATIKSTHRRGRSLTSTRECTNKSNRFADSLPTNRLPNLPSVAAIPTNGVGCIVLRDTGGFHVIGDIPHGLSTLLFRRRGPLPSYIALGTKRRYYVRFEDGSASFHGPASLDRFLKGNAAPDTFQLTEGGTNGRNRRRRDNHLRVRKGNRNAEIVSVAFGKEFGDYFLVRADGSWEANGDLPSGLEKLLDNRRNRGDLRWVALGPEGEWCVTARNGRVWWGGVSREIDEVLGDILIDGQEELNFIDFGVDGSYFLIYR